MPGQPKKALSAYFIWMQENRAKIKEDNPGISLGGIAQKAGEIWRALDDKSVSNLPFHFSLKIENLLSIFGWVHKIPHRQDRNIEGEVKFL